MPRGGKRNGAGRKGGTPNKRTAAAVIKAEAGGLMPLEVMLDAMRRLHEEQKWEKAAAIARDAAPYLHSRLMPVQPKEGNAEVALKITFANSPPRDD